MNFAPVRRAFHVVLLAVALGSVVAGAHAMDVNGRIRGVVTDPSGAVVANATVTATNEATGVKFVTKTLNNGAYLFAQLPIGSYTVTIQQSGFSSFVAKGITLNIDQEYVEPIQLQLGGTDTTIEVSASSVQVNTTDMQLNNVVTSEQMLQLPLIGRNFTALERILPGVAPTDTRFGGTYAVNGSQAQQSAYLINGADSNDIALNTIAIVPSLDAIDQFNLISGPLNAEYDRNSGGIVSATIKQGTNRVHGTGFEYYRDTFLNTNNFFQKTYTNGALTSKVSPYHQHIFGGTAGGPIFRDKLFAFGSYQGVRQRVPQGTFSNIVYTPANLQGNFSTVTFSNNPIPSSITIPGCSSGQTFASCLNAKNGIVPTSAFSSVTSKLVSQYVPAANNGTNGYNYNSTTVSPSDQYMGRVDYAINPRNQITVVGIYQKGNTQSGIPFSGASVPGFGDSSVSHIQQWTLDYVRQINNTTVNDLSAHYTRFNFNSGQPQQIVQPSSAGFNITPQDTANATLPSLAVGGYFTLGGTTNGPQPRIDQVIQLSDSLTKTIGHHTIKAGYDGRRFNVSNLFDASNSGAYSFSTAGNFSSGDASLDFLLGIPSGYSQGTGNVIQADAFLNYLYAQDSWKVTNNFTLNYGMGYQIDTPLRNHQYGGLAVTCFQLGGVSKVFPGAPTNLLFPGDPGCTNSAQATTRYSSFGPRFGFAWAPDLGWISGTQGKFSIRGGFGIYYNRTEEESALQTLGTPPFGFTTGGAADFGGSPSLVNPYADINGGRDNTGAPLGQTAEANRFPYVAPTAGTKVDFTDLLPIYNISTFDKTFRSPYSENFQLSVERELPARMVTRLSYVGSLGRHNQVTYEGNPTTQAGHDACKASASCIANRTIQAYAFPGHTIGNNPDFISIGEVGSYATSNYNSFQASVTKGRTHGLSFQLSYTYAHAMDDASSFENSGFGSSGQRGWNQYQKSLNYGDSTFDTRHNFVFAPTYVTPIMKGRSGFAPISMALSGWEVSAITSLATGQPYDISYAGGSSNSLWCSISISFYACPDVPVQTSDIQRADPRTRLSTGRTRWMQKTSWANEPIGSFGNVHRNPFHGPGINNTNMIVAKNFYLNHDGTISLQLRAESDNVFNHTQFSNPASTWSDTVLTNASSTFGTISGAAAARQTQLAARITF